MHRIFCLCFGVVILTAAKFCGAQVPAQIAPASIAGMIVDRLDPGTFTGYTSTLFKADGTYEPLLVHRKHLTTDGGYSTPPPGGTYLYTVTGLTTARITRGTGDSATTEDFLFSTSEGGTVLGVNPEGSDEKMTFNIRPFGPSESMIATSMRARISNGSSAIVGVAVGGKRVRHAIVRAIGPGLARFGITSGLPDPFLAVYPHTGFTSAYGASWGQYTVSQESLGRLMTMVGMYPLVAESKDAVVLVRMLPGVHMIHCSSLGGAGAGEVVVECYLLP